MRPAIDVPWPAIIPQKQSAISVTTAIEIHSKYIGSDLPYLWCHWNFFSG
jgi:hypothetical protein